MGTKQDILDYYFGESIGITALLKNRNQDVLDLTSVQCTFIVGDEKFQRKLLVIEHSDIIATNIPAGEVMIPISPARQSALRPETVYRYDLWTYDGVNKLHQCGGQFRLRSGFRPA